MLYEVITQVMVDRSSPERSKASLEEAISGLSGNNSVMIYPEGTRSRDGKLQPFKKGGFWMALRVGLPIVPVRISGSREVVVADTLSRITSYNVCYTKLLRSRRAPSRRRTGASRTSSGSPASFSPFLLRTSCHKSLLRGEVFREDRPSRRRPCRTGESPARTEVPGRG